MKTTSLLALLVPAALAACENSSKLDNAIGVSHSTAPVSRSVDQPAKLEFYVMSKCPYGVQVEKAVAPVLDKLGGNVDFHLTFIGQKQGDQLSSMHGPGEVTGDIAQLCAHEVAPDKYMKMVECQDADPQHVDTNWESCGGKFGIDTGAVKACMDSKGQQLLAASFDDAQKRGASGSPTMFLNGKPYNGGRKANDFLRAICATWDAKKPDACTNLPTPVAVNATFFSDARCKKCNIDGLEGRLGQMFEGLKVKKVDYMSPEGKALYADLQKADPTFKTLPTVIFDATLEQDKDGKGQVQRWLKPVGQYQTLALGGNFDPTAEICDNGIDDDGNGKSDCDDPSCKEAMACRPEVKKSIDLFVMSHCPYGTKAMLATKEFADAFGKDASVNVHFIGDNKGGTLSSMHGPDEVADDLREVCAIQHYAKDQKFMDFLACRSKDLKADWKACATGGIEADVISKCADGDEGKGLLTASFQVAQKLDIGSSPTFMVNNRETFNAQDPAGIEAPFCKHNPGLAGCSKQLSGAAPAQAPGGGGAACGTN
jgi:hypothetical protein